MAYGKVKVYEQTFCWKGRRGVEISPKKKKKNHVFSWSYSRQNSVVQYELRQTDKIKRVKTCHIDMEINIAEGTY